MGHDAFGQGRSRWRRRVQACKDGLDVAKQLVEQKGWIVLFEAALSNG